MEQTDIQWPIDFLLVSDFYCLGKCKKSNSVDLADNMFLMFATTWCVQMVPGIRQDFNRDL